MSAKKEVGESRALVVYNGSASRFNETGLQLYPVSEYNSGEGLPYAPIDCTNVGYKWGWRKLSSLPNGEVNDYKRVGLARVGGVGIPSLPVRDPLPSARGS
uniref:DUF7081 domain-containing protein n=1 Tax=Solanum tuberosum TaxID=4113 RepID=M1DJW2_SOLTU